MDLNAECPSSLSPIHGEAHHIGTILVGQQHMQSGVVFSKDEVYTFLALETTKLIKTMHLKPKPACH